MDSELTLRSEQRRTRSLRDAAALLFRHRTLFSVSFGVILASGILYSALSASFVAQMKIVIRRGRIDPAISPAQTAPPLLQNQVISEEELNSEVDLLRDESLLRETVAKSGLAKTKSWLSQLQRESPEQRIEHEVRRLAKSIDVQPARKSQLITVTYSSRDPKLAATVLKTVGDEYLARHTRAQRPAGQHLFFDEQVGIAGRELKRAQRQLEHFTRTSGTVSASLERDLTLQKLSEAQATTFGLQASLAESNGRAQALAAELNKLPPRKVSEIRNGDNPQLQEKLKTKLLELQLRRTQLLTNFQPSYRLVQEVDQQIAKTQATLEAENLAPLRDELTEDNPDYVWANSERVKTSVEMEGLLRRANTAQEQVASYALKAQSLARSAIEQSELDERLKAAEDKYLLYIGKREEARLGDALDQTGILNAAMLEAPHVPVLPSTPLWLACCISVAVACSVSTILVFIADYMDPSLTNPQDVADLLGTPVLASFPLDRCSSKLRSA